MRQTRSKNQVTMRAGLSFAIFATLNIYSSPSLGESENIHVCEPPLCMRVASVEHEPFLSVNTNNIFILCVGYWSKIVLSWRYMHV